jgi:hypothetical protein
LDRNNLSSPCNARGFDLRLLEIAGAGIPASDVSQKQQTDGPFIVAADRAMRDSRAFSTISTTGIRAVIDDSSQCISESFVLSSHSEYVDWWGERERNLVWRAARGMQVLNTYEVAHPEENLG